MGGCNHPAAWDASSITSSSADFTALCSFCHLSDPFTNSPEDLVSKVPGRKRFRRKLPLWLLIWLTGPHTVFHDIHSYITFMWSPRRFHVLTPWSESMWLHMARGTLQIAWTLRRHWPEDRKITVDYLGALTWLEAEDEAVGRCSRLGVRATRSMRESLPVFANFGGEKGWPEAKNSGVSRNWEQAQLAASMDTETSLPRLPRTKFWHNLNECGSRLSPRIFIREPSLGAQYLELASCHCDERAQPRHCWPTELEIINLHCFELWSLWLSVKAAMKN